MKTLALLLFACAASVWGQTVAAPIPVANQQFLDCRTGACLPLNGGKLFSYTAGTLTPKVTYTDSTGTTPNANPVVLNSSGFNAAGSGNAGVWIKGACYKFILKDSANVVLWTQDNVCNQEGLALAALATSGGASLVGYSYPGGTTRTVQSRLADSLSVKDFGATGNGITDDTATIQAAIAAASAAGAGAVFFPPGTYITSGLTMARNVSVECASQGVQLKPSADGVTIFSFVGISYSGISGCGFDGTGKVGTFGIVTSQDGSANVSANLHFNNLEMLNMGTCYTSSNAYFTQIDNSRCLFPTVAGFDVEVNSNTLVCNNCTVLSSATLTLCLRIHGSFGTVWNGGYMEGACTTTIDQNNATEFNGVVWENATGTVEGTAIELGNDGGIATSRGTSFHGCTIGGANVGITIHQTEGLDVTGSDIRAANFAFFIINNGTNVHRGLNFSNNSYFLPGAYDLHKLVGYNVAPANSINDNINQEVINPLLLSPTYYGAVVAVPPDASLANGQAVVYPDAAGVVWVKSKDAAGTITYQAVNNGIFGAPGTGFTNGVTVNTPSLSSSFPSGLTVSGTYNAGTKQTVVRLAGTGVASGGGYNSQLAFQTCQGATCTDQVFIDNGGNLKLVTVQVFANNAAALGGGLTVGTLYRLTGLDTLAVVH